MPLKGNEPYCAFRRVKRAGSCPWISPVISLPLTFIQPLISGPGRGRLPANLPGPARTLRSTTGSGSARIWRFPRDEVSPVPARESHRHEVLWAVRGTTCLHLFVLWRDQSAREQVLRSVRRAAPACPGHEVRRSGLVYAEASGRSSTCSRPTSRCTIARPTARSARR